MVYKRRVAHPSTQSKDGVLLSSLFQFLFSSYPLLVENALPPSSIAPVNPLLPRVTAGSRNVRASIPTIQVRL